MKTIFTGLQAFAWCFFCALAILFLYLYFNGQLSAGSDHPVIEYKDFVSILLTSLAVMIAVATVVVAVAAVWGYIAIREEISKTVKQIASERAEKVALERVDAVVPERVEAILRFWMGDRLNSQAGEVADEYTRERH